jgi:acid stress chaperone HdeB
MKSILLLICAATMLAPPPAHAQRLDLAALRCKAFLAGNKDDVGIILTWLEGYYSEENASPVVDLNAMKEQAARIVEHCNKNLADTVIEAADTVLGKDK